MDAPCAKIDKEIFLISVECPARGWRMRRHGHKEVPTAGDQFRMAQGQEVHRRAQELFPDGVYAAMRGQSVANTQRLLKDSSKRVLFECAFEVGPFTIRADTLVRQPDRTFELIEVKSNSVVKDELISDVAVTAMVLKRAGVPISKTTLLTLSPEYRLGMGVERLFKSMDCTKEALALAAKYDKIADALDKATSGDECPSSPLMRPCKECPFYRSQCHAAGIEAHDILELPRLSNWRIKSLADARILRIGDIPSSPRLLTPTQSIVRSAVISGQPSIDKGRLRNMLAQVRWPCGYLDFESTATALPLYPNVAPHESIVTQYSLHLSDQLGKVSDHREYLADHKRDCRRELAAQLCDDLDGVKSIIVYSGYERMMMRALAKRYPDLADRLDSHASRLFDLEKAFHPQGGYYHPKFGGRSSIKATLPVLVNDLSYQGLDIADGDEATTKFAQMARGEFNDEEVEKIRRDLLRYCAVDSLGMLKLHAALVTNC